MKKVALWSMWLGLSIFVLGCANNTSATSSGIGGSGGGTGGGGEILDDPDIKFVDDPSITADLPDAGEGRVTDDPIEAAYFGVYVWKAAVEKASPHTEVLCRPQGPVILPCQVDISPQDCH